MPIVRIDLWEGRPEEKKVELIKNTSEAIAGTLEIPIEKVTVILYEVNKNDWGIGGIPASKL